MPKEMSKFPKPSRTPPKTGRPSKQEATRIGRDGPYSARASAAEKKRRAIKSKMR